MIGRAIFNQKPLPPNRFASLPMGAIRAAGHWESALEKQASSIKSSLAQCFPGFEGDSAWLGGSLNDAHSAPEALAGLAPLAYVTGDETLIALIDRFVAWAIASQRKDGDFGPAQLTDWWPKMLMLRVMRMYFTHTADREALKCMDKFFRYQLQALPEQPLRDFAAARAAENMQSVLFVYNLTQQAYLLKLCDLLRAQSLDWTNEMHIFPHIRSTARQRPWPQLKKGLESDGGLLGTDQKVHGRDYHLTHALNVAFGLKAPGIINLFKSGFKEVNAFKTGFPKYMKHHGVSLWMFTGDHHLSGANPSQGIDMASVSEMINSLGTLVGTGDEFGWEMADIMEMLAFNALPAAWDDNMDMRQQCMQVNQLDASDAPRDFYNASDDTLCFDRRSLDLSEQGLAQFTQNLWYATSDDGLAALSYVPCTVSFVAGGQRVRVQVEGNYPFESNVRIRVAVKAPCEFPLYLRIPGWAQSAMLSLPDGEIMQMGGGEIACVRRVWTGEEQLTIDMPMTAKIQHWAHKSGAVELGPLVMALPVHYNENGIDTWNWALCEKEPMKVLYHDDTAQALKQGTTPVSVLVKAAKVPTWLQDGLNCQSIPVAPNVEPEREVIELTPFGTTTLRIAQFPVVE